MKKIENFRLLIIFVAFLVLTTAICIANIIKLNIFALVFDMVMIVSICFVLGYSYCLYECEKSRENKEQMEFPNTIPKIKDEEVNNL